MFEIGHAVGYLAIPVLLVFIVIKAIMNRSQNSEGDDEKGEK